MKNVKLMKPLIDLRMFMLRNVHDKELPLSIPVTELHFMWTEQQQVWKMKLKGLGIFYFLSDSSLFQIGFSQRGV